MPNSDPTVDKGGKRVAIIQSNYIPWKGYFDMLANADVVILLDSVQSTKNDWRNRNVIKTQSGMQWLSIPIQHSNSLRIREVKIAQRGWAKKHFRTISQAYSRAPYANEMLPLFERWFEAADKVETLSEVNRIFIRGICETLGVTTDFVDVEEIMSDSDHDALDPSARLVALCRHIQAKTYITGPAARVYLDTGLFADAGIAVEWFDYDGYPEHVQLHGAYNHHVSVLDLLLMTGANAHNYAIRNFRPL